MACLDTVFSISVSVSASISVLIIVKLLPRCKWCNSMFHLFCSHKWIPFLSVRTLICSEDGSWHPHHVFIYAFCERGVAITNSYSQSLGAVLSFHGGPCFHQPNIIFRIVTTEHFLLYFSCIKYFWIVKLLLLVIMWPQYIPGILVVFFLAHLNWVSSWNTSRKREGWCIQKSPGQIKSSVFL